MGHRTASLKQMIRLRLLLTLTLVYSLLALIGYQLVHQSHIRQEQAGLVKEAETIVRLLSNNALTVETALTIFGDSEATSLSHQKNITNKNDNNKVALVDGYYQVAKKIPGADDYLVFRRPAQANTQLLIFLVLLGLLLITITYLVLSASLDQVFRLFGRINDLFKTVITQPSLKTLPLNETEVVYTETKDLVDNLNEMMLIIDDQNTKQLRFISDVSHELRTPVSVMKGYMSMLLRWGKEDPVVLEESLQASLKETTRMEIMIKDMLDMIRIRGSFEEHRNDVTDVEDSLETVLSNFKILHSDVLFKLTSDEVLPFAKIYQVHFEQILVILIDNAIKYSPAKKEIDISLHMVNQHLKLHVRDKGQGISPEDTKHIFDRFFRASSSRNRQETSAGVGIGLSLLKQITDAYNIEVDVKSILGQGTEFILSLPTEDLSDVETSYNEQPANTLS